MLPGPSLCVTGPVSSEYSSGTDPEIPEALHRQGFFSCKGKKMQVPETGTCMEEKEI